jgi:hypothetical protein
MLASNADANGAGDTNQRRSQFEIAPADGIRLPFFGSGDFGTSPFFGQLSVEAIRSTARQSTILVAHTKDRTESGSRPVTRGTMIDIFCSAGGGLCAGCVQVFGRCARKSPGREDDDVI